MTTKAWPDLRKGTGEVLKSLKIFWGNVGELFGGHGFGFLFSPRTSRSKLQNINIILLDALPDATDALSNASIVYYSSKRYLYKQHFWKIA